LFELFQICRLLTTTRLCARPFYHYEDDKAQQKKRLCLAYVAPGVSLLRHQKVVLSF
jgi:hypothetical protein